MKQLAVSLLPWIGCYASPLQVINPPAFLSQWSPTSTWTQTTQFRAQRLTIIIRPPHLSHWMPLLSSGMPTNWKSITVKMILVEPKLCPEMWFYCNNSFHWMWFSASSNEVSRARSVEELLSASPSGSSSPVPPPEGPSSLPGRPELPSKGPGGKVDWKNFQEAVSSSGILMEFVSCKLD